MALGAAQADVARQLRPGQIFIDGEEAKLSWSQIGWAVFHIIAGLLQAATGIYEGPLGWLSAIHGIGTVTQGISELVHLKMVTRDGKVVPFNVTEYLYNLLPSGDTAYEFIDLGLTVFSLYKGVKALTKFRGQMAKAEQKVQSIAGKL